MAKQVHDVVGREKLAGLDNLFRARALKVIAFLQEKGWQLRIVWGRRTPAENEALVNQGLASLTSKHLDGKALDLIDRGVGYSPNRSHPFYKDMEQACKAAGVVWGGHFSSRWDPCHFEMP